MRERERETDDREREREREKETIEKETIEKETRTKTETEIRKSRSAIRKGPSKAARIATFCILKKQKEEEKEATRLTTITRSSSV